MADRSGAVRAHRFLTKILPAVVLGAALPAIGGAAEVSFPYPLEVRSLPNGLDVWVVPMPTPGVVAWETRMDVGSGAEVDPGRTGFAHFFEHLMFHGTEALPGPEREAELLRLGVDDGGWTSIDETSYPATLPASSLERWIAIEADRVRHLHLVEERLRKEAGAVYGEFRKSRANPESVLEDEMMARLFGSHPYGHSTLGIEADIAAMPDQFVAATAFFDTWYRPEHASLVIAGDVTMDQIDPWIRDAYGPWERGAVTPPDPGPPAQATDHTPIEVVWETATEPVLHVFWRTPVWSDPGAPAVAWAASLLAAPNGPLDTHLVRAGLARSAEAYTSDTVQAGYLQVRVVASDPADLPELRRVVLEQVAALSAGPDAATLDALRTRKRYAVLSGLDSPSAVARLVAGQARRDPDPEHVGRRLNAELSVTAEDVARAAATWLTPEQAFVGTLVGGAG